MAHITPSGGGSATVAAQSTALGADQALTAATQAVVLSLTLPAGTWILHGGITVNIGTGGNACDYAIVPHGGAASTAYCAGQIRSEATGSSVTGACTGVVTLGSSTQVDLVAFPTIASTAKKLTGNASYANATTLVAVPH